MKTSHVTVIGDGAMGTVLAMMLAASVEHVYVLSRDQARTDFIQTKRHHSEHFQNVRLPDNVIFTTDKSVLNDTKLIVSALPTQVLRSALPPLLESVSIEIGVVSTSKGLERQTSLRPSEIFSSVLPGRPIAVLSGPNMAHEIAEGMPAATCLASTDVDFAQFCRNVFSNPAFRAYDSNDVIGVELCGALKNCIAIAAGIVDGLNLGMNAKSALLARGTVEIARFGLICGAEVETFIGLAGVGDLATTCFSPLGRNRAFGERLTKGMSIEQALDASHGVVEGVSTVGVVVEIAKNKNIEMPICEQVFALLEGQISAKEAINSLMQRDLRSDGV